MRLRRIPVAIMMVLAGASFARSQGSDVLTRFSFTEYHMGVDARIVVFARNQAVAERACIAAFARIAELDTSMSDYRKDSELNRLCARAGAPPMKVSDDLFGVLERAQRISASTRGAFDVTIGPLVRLWRQARKFKVLPLPDEVESARALVGFRMVKLDSKRKTVSLAKKGMQLDLGGIAKGYACDAAQKVLRANGVLHALVEMGGDIVVSGPPPGKQGWAISVPNDLGKSDKTQFFANCAISSSGDTEQFVVLGGKRFSHVVDPRTGWAVTNRVQATVIAKNGFTSDPLSKIFALLDPFQAHKVAQSFGVKRAYVKVARD